MSRRGKLGGRPRWEVSLACAWKIEEERRRVGIPIRHRVKDAQPDEQTKATEPLAGIEDKEI